MGDEHEDWWRACLDGSTDIARREREFNRLLPSEPRCKFCNIPFGGPGALVTRIRGIARWPKNPRYCDRCFTHISEHPGGAELEISMLFADVRGSSAFAERMTPKAFTGLMNRFFETATRIVVASEGVVEKLIGDQVAALYIPGFAGPGHARRALSAARDLLDATGHRVGVSAWIPIGIGLHTGVAYVGNVGDMSGVSEFTALGDSVNTTARLASAAKAGEIIASEAVLRAAGEDATAGETRELELKGKVGPVRVRVLS